MALVIGGQGLGTLRTGKVVQPTKTAAPKAGAGTAAASNAFAKTGATYVGNAGSSASSGRGAAAPAPPPDYNTLMAQAVTQASTLAAAQIAAQIKAITDQQDAIRANATAQAGQINDASLAAAKFLAGLGDRTAADYSAATNNLTGMAQGFTGGLRDDAQAAADAAQHGLAGIAGNDQTIANKGPDLANLLYGVSGYIPANALQVQGLGAVAAANAIPAQTVGYGQSQASGTLATGNQSADALNSQIDTIRASLPSTTATYLNQFQTQAQNAVTNARNAYNDAYTRTRNAATDARDTRNINSEIAARSATTKANALKNAPHPDKATSFDGYLRDQYGKLWTVTKNGIKYAQPAPGFHFNNVGRPVADPKPTTPAQVAAALARFASTYHYKTDLAGNPLKTSTGAYIPVAPYVLDPKDPAGHTVMKPLPPTKPFVPKIDKTISAANGAITYYDPRVGKWVEPRNPKTGLPITYDPNKPAALKLFNSDGQVAVFDPNTRTVTKLVDENKIPLVWGTPKAPPVAHYGNRFIDGTTGHWMVVNSLDGTAHDTGSLATAKERGEQGTWSTLPKDKDGHVWRINSITNELQPVAGYQGSVPVASTGTWSSFTGPNGNLWRINNKTNAKKDMGFKAQTPVPVGSYSSIKSPDGKFLWRINSVTNKIVKTPLPWPTSAHGALTAESVQIYTSKINAQLTAMENGIPPDPNKPGATVTVNGVKYLHPPVTSRSEAKARLDHAGYMTKALRPLALAILEEYYPLHGASGHNWFRVTNPALSGG